MEFYSEIRVYQLHHFTAMSKAVNLKQINIFTISYTDQQSTLKDFRSINFRIRHLDYFDCIQFSISSLSSAFCALI